VRRFKIISPIFVFFFLFLCSGVFAQQCDICGVWGPSVWRFSGKTLDRGVHLEVLSVNGTKLKVIYVLQNGLQWKNQLEKRSEPRVMPLWGFYGVIEYKAELRQDESRPYFVLKNKDSRRSMKFTLMEDGVLTGSGEDGAATVTLKRTQQWVLGR
jgi:hypothetical protein